MTDVPSRSILTWDQFAQFVIDLKDTWVFRGHSCAAWPLQTRFERALDRWGIPLTEALAVEWQMVREFRRGYAGSDGFCVLGDFLYCLARIQHYGGPTRLLDWTYSPYIGLQFAVGTGSTDAALWCVRTGWCNAATESVIGAEAQAARNSDSTRDDSSFSATYGTAGRRFVAPENAYRLNPRILAQKAVFLCQGDCAATFMDNLLAMDGWADPGNLLKLHLPKDHQAIRQMAFHLRPMNVQASSLFAGEEGACKSLEENLPLFQDFHRRRIGR
jgi:hypothetical protein